MLKSRDIGALLAILWLSRMAWRDPAESLSANAFLSWYLPQHNERNHEVEATVSLLDVDGDHKPETVVAIVQDETTKLWSLEVRDLKPAASTDKTHLAPFKPKLLYTSKPIVLEGEPVSLPLSVTTGHVNMLFQRKKAKEPHSADDRTRHYFCGVDWHDASSKCGTPCPKGQADECPDGERCYADTPCDSHATAKSALDQADFHLTNSGGIPSIFVLWGSGSVTMHSLTAPKDESGSKSILQLEQQWVMSSSKDLNRTMTAWDDASLNFLDSIDTDSPGMVIMTGYVDFKRTGKESSEAATTTIAINAKTGSVVWDAYHLDDPEPDIEPPILPMNRGSTSNARRRSMIPTLEDGPHLKVVEDQNAHGNHVNCLKAYRRSLLTSGILPYMYQNHEDAGIQLAHFTHHDHRPHQVQKKDRKGKLTTLWRRKKTHHRKTHLGKPNVVVSRNYRGLHVRSLKNGKSVCHLSLWDNSLYADLNHDGILDSVQAIAGDADVPDFADESENDDEYDFYRSLLKRVSGASDAESKEEVEKGAKTAKTAKMCHLMALSGVPNKEELFSINMCDRKSSESDLAATTVMAVEPSNGKGNDLIVPLSNGRVVRYRGPTGRRMWHLAGSRYDDFPSWEESELVKLDRIESPNTIPATRPVLLTGESSLALLSPSSGSVLTTASFPQPVTRKPMLVDFNSDGTTDVVVVTADAVWAYRVSVNTGASIFFRIVVGLLMASMMLAILKNRFGPNPGKRSTDL